MFKRYPLTLAVLALIGCHSVTNADGPQVSGTVQSVIVQDAVSIIRLGVAGSAPRDSLDLRLEVETPVLVHDAGGASHAGSRTDVVVGDSIRATHSGIALRSLPPQYLATSVDVYRPR